MDAVAMRFNRVADSWDANPTRVELARAVAQAIRKAVPLRPEMTVLDFGAGTGLLSLALLPHVRAITALDASGEMLRVLTDKLAAAGIPNVRTLHADISSGGPLAAEFDLVVSSMALHHVQDVPAAIARLRAGLKPGGWLALADLDKEDGSFHGDNASGVYHTGFARTDLIDWFTAAGLTDVALCVAHRIDRGGRAYDVLLVSGRGT